MKKIGAIIILVFIGIIYSYADTSVSGTLGPVQILWLKSGNPCVITGYVHKISFPFVAGHKYKGIGTHLNIRGMSPLCDFVTVCPKIGGYDGKEF